MANQSSPLPPATFFQRTSAWAFDVSVALWPASLIAWMGVGSQRRDLELRQADVVANSSQAISYLGDLASLYIHQGVWTLAWVALIYGAGSVWSEAGLHQATWGKRLMGISVEAIPGRREDHWAVATRFLAGSLSWLTMNIGHAMSRWRSDKRALHDVVAGMRVVQEPMPVAARNRGVWVCWGVFVATQVALVSLRPVDPVLMDVFRQLPL